MIRVEQVEISQDQVKVQLHNFSTETRLHVFAQTFMPNFADSLRDELEAAVKTSSGTVRHPFAQWKNMFESNIAIGDEMMYVQDRQKREPVIGNTLAKPTLLVNRHFLCET